MAILSYKDADGVEHKVAGQPNLTQTERDNIAAVPSKASSSDLTAEATARSNADLLKVDKTSMAFNVKWPAYGAVGDNTTDDTTAIQAALTACLSAGGGVVYFPSGKYKTTATLNLTDKGVRGTTINADNAEIQYYGSGDAVVVTSSGTSTNSHHPYFAIRGLNVNNASGGSATSGLHFRTCSATWLENVTVRGFVDNYIWENHVAWTENTAMLHCNSIAATNAHVRFMKSGSGTNSFARFQMNSLFASGGQYIVQVDVGCALYDARVGPLNGNFSGVAHIYLNGGGMEGSEVNGIFTEGSPTALMKVGVGTTRIPTIYNRGSYVGNTYTFIDDSNAPIGLTDSSLAIQPFRVITPRFIASGQVRQLEFDGRTDTLYTPTETQTYLEDFTLTASSATATTQAGTKTLFTGTKAVGRLKMYYYTTSGDKCGGYIIDFAVMGGTVTQTISLAQAAKDTGFYQYWIEAPTINIDGTYSFTYRKNDSGTPDQTLRVFTSLEMLR